MDDDHKENIEVLNILINFIKVNAFYTELLGFRTLSIVRILINWKKKKEST
jgi:hypothetical protein